MAHDLVALADAAALAHRVALDRRHVQRRRQVVDDGVEQRLHALVLEGRAAEHGGQLDVERRLRRLSPGRHRRASRLGAGSLPARRARPGEVRRDRSFRARGSAAGRAPGLGHAHLQLRAERSQELPAGECALLAARVPRGRPARRRGGVDALSRLLPQPGRVDTEQVRRA